MGYTTLPITGVCFVPTGQANEFCLPETIDCTPTPDDGLIQLCDERWNCNLCQTDKRYWVPYYAGDKFMLQLAFRDKYNPDPENPVDGWGTFVRAFLINSQTGATVSSNVADFASRYLVGWANGGSIQLIEVDTSLPAFNNLPCWRIEFKSYKPAGLGVEVDGEYCTNDFAMEVCGLVGIRSEIDGYDDMGNWYGEITGTIGVGDYFQFDNWIRAHASVTFTGIVNEKYIVGRRRAGGDTAEVHIFEILVAVPPFMFRYLTKAIFAGYEVEIDGKTYQCPSQSIQRKNKGSNMFVFSVDLQVTTTQTTC